jgi:hypothetical protein
MKSILLVLTLASATAMAQDTITRDTYRILPSPKEKEALAASTRVEKPNEIKIGRKTFSGVAVQLIKTDNPLQLINPFAPKEYGSGEDTLVADRDPVTGNHTGLKFFSVSFGR